MKEKNEKEIREGYKLTDVGIIPEDWEVKKLEGNALVKGRIGWKNLKQEEYTKTGPYLIAGKHIKKGNINWNSCDHITEERYLESIEIALENNDVIFSKDGTLGNPAIIRNLTEKATINGTMMLVRVKNDIISPEYFYQILQSIYFDRMIKTIKSGSSIPHIFQRDMNEFKVILPSLEEQEKIAEILTTWDESIEKLENIIESEKEYKKGMMQKIFNQEIRFIPKGTSSLCSWRSENGKDYPAWEEKKLGEIANFRRGSFPQPYGLAKWFDEKNGVPFIQVFDVAENMRLKEKTKTKISKLAEDYSVYVEKNTIIITLQGSIGRVAKTQYSAYIDRTLLIFQSYNLPINIDYFKYSIFLLFEIEKLKAPGGTIKTITKEVLTSFRLLVPVLEEQEKIANFLTTLDDKIEVLEKKLEKIKEQKKGLMQKLLTGEIRINI